MASHGFYVLDYAGSEVVIYLIAGLPFLLLAVVIGGVFGSFLTCVLYRSPRGLSLWAPPSACPHCQTKLRPWDLIPVLSWLSTAGKCRYCRAPIGKTYLGIELYSIALAVAALAISIYLGTYYLLFLPLYGGLMGASFALMMAIQWHLLAFKSVAFVLLCSGIYVAVLLV